MIEVECSVPVYEIDDKAVDAIKEKITVKNHWNRDSFIVIVINKKEYTVDAAELQAAITNATHIKRY